MTISVHNAHVSALPSASAPASTQVAPAATQNDALQSLVHKLAQLLESLAAMSATGAVGGGLLQGVADAVMAPAAESSKPSSATHASGCTHEHAHKAQQRSEKHAKHDKHDKHEKHEKSERKQHSARTERDDDDDHVRSTSSSNVAPASTASVTPQVTTTTAKPVAHTHAS